MTFRFNKKDEPPQVQLRVWGRLTISSIGIERKRLKTGDSSRRNTVAVDVSTMCRRQPGSTQTDRDYSKDNNGRPDAKKIRRKARWMVI